MPRTDVLTFYATSLTYTPSGGSEFDFGRVGEVRQSFKPDLGGFKPNGSRAVRGFNVETVWLFKNPDYTEDWDNLSNFVNTEGTLSVIRSDGQTKNYEGNFYFEAILDYDSKPSGFRCSFSGFISISDLQGFADIEADALYSLTKLQHDLTLVTDEVSKTITTINAGTSPYTTATVTTSGAHGFAVGQIVTIAGNGQTDYNGDFAIQSVPSSTTFTITVPVATPTSGNNGTATRKSRTFYFRCDWRIIVYTDFKVRLFIKNFLPYDQPSTFTWQGYISWKTAASTWKITGAGSAPDAVTATSGFGSTGFVLNTAGDGDWSAFTIVTDGEFQLFASLQSDTDWNDIFSTGFYKRLTVPEFETINGATNIRVIEALTLEAPEFGTIYKGYVYQVDVFESDDTYSSGFSLSKLVEFSGNNLTEPISCFRVTGVPPTTETIHDYEPESPLYWMIKAMNQTTAITEGLQFWIDKSGTPHKIRLSGDSGAESSEITTTSDILSAGQKLVVIYRVAFSAITSIDWIEV